MLLNLQLSPSYSASREWEGKVGRRGIVEGGLTSSDLLSPSPNCGLRSLPTRFVFRCCSTVNKGWNGVFCFVPELFQGLQFFASIVLSLPYLMSGCRIVKWRGTKQQPNAHHTLMSKCVVHYFSTSESCGLCLSFQKNLAHWYLLG